MNISKEKGWWLVGLLVVCALIGCWISYTVGLNSGDYKLVFTRGDTPYYWQFYRLQQSGSYLQTAQISADSIGDTVCSSKSRSYLTLVVNDHPKRVAPVCDNEQVYSGLIAPDTSSVYTRFAPRQ